MSRQHVVRGILCGLLAMAGPAQAQQNTVDPMLGGYGVGKSEEIVFIEGQYQTPTNIYIGLYDWNPTTSELIPKDSIPLVTCTTQDWGPKQVDIAVGDFNCDAKDDIVAVAQTTDTTFDLIIPRFVPGTLTWDTPHIWHSSPSALYFDPDIRTDWNGNISGLRLLAADLDSIPGQEFVLAYLTPDTQVQLVVYKTDSLLNPIAVDSVLDPDRLFTTRASDCNERSHVFDITAGDFDGDWIDEIMLIGEYRDASDHYVLYSSIYEYSGGSLHRVHRQDSIMWQGRYGGVNNIADRIAVAAADYRGTGRDQALLFMHELGGCEQMTGYLFGLTPSSAMDDMDTVRLIAWSNWWSYSPTNNAATSDHGLSSVDLNLDGRAEFVIKGGRYMKVGSWQENATVTWRSGDIVLLGAFDRVTDSRRSVIFADLDADTAQASWTPEIIAGFNDAGTAAGHIRTWSVNIDLSDSITGITAIHEIDLSPGMQDTWYSLVYAAGDFDGDGVRLGKPNHVSFTHTAEPLVVLNSPPMHYDILGTDTADVLGFYTQGNQETYARYETNAMESQSVTAAHSSNWNFSASAGGTKDLWVGSFSAKVTAAYGGSASRISGTASSHFTSEAVTVIEGDRANVRSVPYDVWEYPFYVGDAMHGYYVVARPRDDQSVKGWSSLAGLPSTSYIPKHEVGNLLSYPSSMADLLNRGDVDTILSDLNSWEVLRLGGAITQAYGVDEITTTESSRSRSFSINLETEAELFGLKLSASASQDQTSVQTRSSTLESGFEVTTSLGALTGVFSSAEYRVTPVFFWSTSGALVLDYIVDSLAPGGDLTWWTENYSSAPDPAFLLPWRYARAKRDSLLDTTKAWRTSDLYFRPQRPVRGDVVTIHGKVWNYSLDSLTQDVEIRMYDGDPSCEETSPLLNTLNDSLVVITGGIGPRQFKPFEFEWEVPLGTPEGARIYAVLDPRDLIEEIHDNNNMCWRGVFTDGPAPSACTPACPITMTGDANENGSITSADIIHMVNFVFKGGTPPGPCEAAGDVNCSGNCTSADIISLVNFVFKGGTPPCDACTTDPANWHCP